MNAMEKFRTCEKILKKRKGIFLPVPTFLLYAFCPSPTPYLCAHSYMLTHALMSALCLLYFIMLHDAHPLQSSKEMVVLTAGRGKALVLFWWCLLGCYVL